ncbi:patatin-like protein 6 [Zingiber officinale]|uniref:PNPLA domain-containing protein n=1 Tax=Zingiber officinale TaxID=94328 RepID=A0A8J5FDE8_ZINOF|nr:patatin-like protein 6 [Zingiber officinale]KAG6485491.1 hypothetical protein ZIOFF_054029 [Zingiber officinale]
MGRKMESRMESTEVEEEEEMHRCADEEATVAAVAEEPSIDADKLSYEIFSILESKFLFDYDDHNKLWLSAAPSVADSAPPAPEEAMQSSSFGNQRGKVCVLCIDGGGGGGMRGILPGKAVSYLEQALKAKSGDPDARISDYFDLAAGTGVGGVFVAMLFASRDGVRPLFEADDTWRFLADKGKNLLRKASSSRSAFLRCLSLRGGASTTAGVDRAMKEAFGKDLTLRDTVKPVLIPCYDLLTSAPLVFSRADAVESEGFNFRLWEVCRATWAEPGLFAPAEISSVDGTTACVGVDGGLTMSNPTAAAITHVLHNKYEFPFVRGVEDLMVLSLGCGDAVDGRRGAREWTVPVSRIAAGGAADLVDQSVALAFGQCRSSNYVRVQGNGRRISVDADFCDVKALSQASEEMLRQKNVESVLFAGKRVKQETNMEKLDWFAGELVLEHRRRSCRIAPTVAFKRAIPKPTNRS